MSYQSVYDLLLKVEVPEAIKDRRNNIPKAKYSSDFEHVRYGEPNGTVKFDKVSVDREKLLKHYFSRGYGSWPRDINPEFRKHVALFRTCLDFWEQFSKDKIFCKEEIYVRCLSEGHSFTEYVKKCRATCLRGMTSETETEIEDGYFFDDYSGYNSIIHERYLIHWDDTEEIDDIKYAFMPTKKVDEKKFRRWVKDLFDDFHISDCEAPDEIDMLRELKNTKMYDPVRGKTTLMRSMWREGIDTSTSYFAKRAVVPTEPGSTRDTGIGDPSTILKVKLLNRLARIVSERIPYSANTTAEAANQRYLRVLKRNAFLHLDFKKFGLTFPRVLMNITIEEIGKYLGADITDLLINSFTVEIDKECYRTERGTMLGWLDAINSIAVCAILHSLVKRGIKIDFVTFNDDVEISMRATDARGSLELLRTLVLGVIGAFDIPISMNKTYGSRASVFLERYCYYDRYYDIDMYKEQLTVKAYAQSCVTRYPWKAKMLFAAAEQWTKSSYATDRCIDTCPVEFDQRELNASLWCGGWYVKIHDKLDWSLVGAHNDLITLGSHLQRWKTPNYTQEDTDVSSLDKVHFKIENNQGYAGSPGEGRLTFNMNETLNDINIEDDNLLGNIISQCVLYTGMDTDYPNRVLRILEEIQGPRDWGPKR